MSLNKKIRFRQIDIVGIIAFSNVVVSVDFFAISFQSLLIQSTMVLGVIEISGEYVLVLYKCCSPSSNYLSLLRTQNSPPLSLGMQYRFFFL